MYIEFENQTLGLLTVTPGDDRIKEYTEALIMLGFEPVVKMD